MGWKRSAAAVGTSILGLTACGDSSDGGGKGKLRVLLQAEATITDGLDKGDEVENTKDYSVRYTKFLATIGNVSMKKSGSGAKASLPDVFVADLTEVGEQGIELGVLDDVEAGQWDKFGFETPGASKGVKALGGVSDDDLATMIKNGWTYWVEGSVQRAEADGGPVKFVIQAETATLFSDCELDGEPGVAVVEDGSSSATLTIHGDHIFFNSFPTGSEGSVKRLAAWVIQADRDMDGIVTTADLRSTDATEVFTSAAGYSLDGAPIDIENALDYVRAQLATQGHLNGEGECVWEFEGATGD